MWIVDKRFDAILRIVTTRQTSKTISYLNFQYIYEVSCTSTFNHWSIIYSSYFYDWNDNISVKTGYNKKGGNFDHSFNSTWPKINFFCDESVHTSILNRLSVSVPVLSFSSDWSGFSRLLSNVSNLLLCDSIFGGGSSTVKIWHLTKHLLFKIAKVKWQIHFLEVF